MITDNRSNRQYSVGELDSDSNARSGGGVQMKKIVALLLFPISVIAEPGPTTQYLINERATMLDIGMMRLNTLTTEFRERVGLFWMENEEPTLFRAEIYSQYDPDDDKIRVSFSIMNSEPTAPQMADGCKNAMMQMNIWLMKSLPRLFLHTGYDDPSTRMEFDQGLKEMFELRCYFSSGRDTSEGRFWASRALGPPGSSEMNIGKWKMRN